MNRLDDLYRFSMLQLGVLEKRQKEKLHEGFKKRFYCSSAYCLTLGNRDYFVCGGNQSFVGRKNDGNKYGGNSALSKS